MQCYQTGGKGNKVVFSCYVSFSFTLLRTCIMTSTPTTATSSYTTRMRIPDVRPPLQFLLHVSTLLLTNSLFSVPDFSVTQKKFGNFGSENVNIKRTVQLLGTWKASSRIANKGRAIRDLDCQWHSLKVHRNRCQGLP